MASDKSFREIYEKISLNIEDFPELVLLDELYNYHLRKANLYKAKLDNIMK